jgi:hypothetical protein
LPETLHIPTLEAAVEEIKGRKHDAMVEKENIQAELTELNPTFNWWKRGFRRMTSD